MQVFTKEQTEEAFRKSPQAINDLIIFGILPGIVLEVTRKHKLHVDTVGNVIQVTTNLVIGLLTPEQFVSELKSIGVTDTVVSDLTTALNDKIFGPMRKAQEDALKKPTVSPQPSTQKTAPVSVSIQKPTIPPPQQPKPTVPQNAPRPTPTPQAQGQGSVTPPVHSPAQATKPPATFMPKPVQPPVQTRSVPPVHVPSSNTPPPRPVVHTMMRDAQHAGDAPAKLVPPPPPVQTQKPTPSTVPAPHAVPSPTPVTVEPVAPAAPQQQKPRPFTPTVGAASEPVKKYGADPYREPVE